MDNYEKEVNKNVKRNEKFLLEFEKYLEDKGLTDKTIEKHVSNMGLFLNDFLNYYEPTKMEDGPLEVYTFLSDWFIRKCMWSSKTYIKENASSIKKFYKCMSENNHISSKLYEELCKDIKNNMDYFLEVMDDYDNEVFNYPF